jgi:hypothetical protein
MSDNTLLVAREMICIKKYLDLHKLEIFQEDILKQLKVPKTKALNVEDDFPILTIKQKESFLGFMKYFVEIRSAVDISFIDYYVKTYNYCNNDQLPVIDIISFTAAKNPKRETFKLLDEYKLLLRLANTKGSSSKRTAITKGLPSYNVVSKLRAKYQFGQEN